MLADFLLIELRNYTFQRKISVLISVKSAYLAQKAVNSRNTFIEFRFEVTFR